MKKIRLSITPFEIDILPMFKKHYDEKVKYGYIWFKFLFIQFEIEFKD